MTDTATPRKPRPRPDLCDRLLAIARDLDFIATLAVSPRRHGITTGYDVEGVARMLRVVVGELPRNGKALAAPTIERLDWLASFALDYPGLIKSGFWCPAVVRAADSVTVLANRCLSWNFEEGSPDES